MPYPIAHGSPIHQLPTEYCLKLLSPWLLAKLACPVHHTPLTPDKDQLACGHGCRYSVVHGIPVLLSPQSADFPHDVFGTTLTAIADGSAWTDYGNSAPDLGVKIDPWVAEMVGATNSNLYKHLVGRLQRYPLPKPPFHDLSNKGTLLDIGCGWGRWALATALNGQQSIGIDPSLRSVLAAARVAKQLGVAEQTAFVVADARSLPFASDSLQRAYSYSVMQHFPKPATRQSLTSLNRVLVSGAASRIHLLNSWGLRSFQIQLMRGFRPARDFEVRYWRPTEMLTTFNDILGPSQLQADSFFVQAQATDSDMLTPSGRNLVKLSTRLTSLAQRLPLLAHLADNLFINSTVQKQ